MRDHEFIDFSLPIELRLLLSPDKDCVSHALRPLALDEDVAMLAGRDSRFSRSISERNGRFGVSSSVNSNTGVEPPTGAEFTTTNVSFTGSFSDGGVDVIGVNDVVYH